MLLSPLAFHSQGTEKHVEEHSFLCGCVDHESSLILFGRGLLLITTTVVATVTIAGTTHEKPLLYCRNNAFDPIGLFLDAVGLSPR